ncbi:MAG: hypothetical protein V4819_16720 [Verrucomicrobiota bacterium]
MKKNLRNLAGAAVGAVVALGFSSCAYDPYYASPAVGASYSTGYGHGYGYGGSGFSTSVFIGTGDPNWGYDPYAYSYYDYRSRRYYDPYSYGYYPVGYRPPVVYGVPHPYGWRPGGGYIRPPVHVTNVTLSNYQNREYRYRNSNYGWAKQVRSQQGAGRPTDQRPAQSKYDNNRNSQTTYSRPNTESRTSTTNSRNVQSGNQAGTTRTDSRTQNKNRLPSRYNTPVTSPQEKVRQGQRTAQANKNSRPQAPGNPQKGNRTEKEKQAEEEMKRNRNYR